MVALIFYAFLEPFFYQNKKLNKTTLYGPVGTKYRWKKKMNECICAVGTILNIIDPILS